MRTQMQKHTAAHVQTPVSQQNKKHLFWSLRELKNNFNIWSLRGRRPLLDGMGTTPTICHSSHSISVIHQIRNPNFTWNSGRLDSRTLCLWWPGNLDPWTRIPTKTLSGQPWDWTRDLPPKKRTQDSSYSLQFIWDQASKLGHFHFCVAESSHRFFLSFDIIIKVIKQAQKYKRSSLIQCVASKTLHSPPVSSILTLSCASSLLWGCACAPKTTFRHSVRTGLCGRAWRRSLDGVVMAWEFWGPILVSETQ